MTFYQRETFRDHQIITHLRGRYWHSVCVDCETGIHGGVTENEVRQAQIKYCEELCG